MPSQSGSTRRLSAVHHHRQRAAGASGGPDGCRGRGRVGWLAPCLVLATFVLILAPGGAFASDPWEPPFEISEPMDLDTHEPGDPFIQTFNAEIVPLSDGSSIVAWIRYAQWNDALHTHLQMRRIAPDGSLGPIINLTEPGSTELPVRVLGLAADANDNVVLVWYAVQSEGTSVWPTISNDGSKGPREIPRGGQTPRARWIHADGSLGDVLDLSDPLAVIDEVRVVMGPDGVATAGWLYGSALREPQGSTPENPTFISAHRRIAARRIFPDQSLGKTVDVTVEQEEFFGENDGISMIADSTGAVAVAWSWDPVREYPATDFEGLLQAMAVIEPDGSLERIHLNELDAGDQARPEAHAHGPKLAVHPDDTLTAIWPSRGPYTGPVTRSPVRLTFRQLHRQGTVRVLGAFGHLEEPEPQIALGRRWSEWDIAAGPDGAAIAVWRLQVDPAQTLVRARTVDARGVLGDKLDASGYTTDVVATRVAMRPGGEAVILWGAVEGDIFSPSDLNYALHARRLLGDGNFGPATVLSELPTDYLRLAIDRSGNVTAAWATATLVQGLIHTMGSRLLGYTVGGTVTGLQGEGLVLQNLGGDDLAIDDNGPFTIPAWLNSGSDFAVTVLTQPTNPRQTCSVSNGTGTVDGARVVDVSVTCEDAHGVCGEATGVPSLLFPGDRLCAVGTPTDQASADGAHHWTCLGIDQGAPARCTAPGADAGGAGGATLAATALDGNDTCTLTDASLVAPPEGLPAGVSLPFGALDFTLQGCSGGATVTLTYPAPVDGLVFWKHIHGSWQVVPEPDAVLAGNALTLTLLDNGPWDAEPTDGTIRDPGGPGTPPSPAIPTLQLWGVLLLGTLLGLLGRQHQRRTIA